jgi:hypothetical protein
MSFEQIGLFVESVSDLIRARLNPIDIYLQQNRDKKGNLIGYPFLYTKKGNSKTEKIVSTINEKFIGVYKISSVNNTHTIGGKIHFLNNKTFFEAKNIIVSVYPNATIIPKCEVLNK